MAITATATDDRQRGDPPGGARDVGRCPKRWQRGPSLSYDLLRLRAGQQHAQDARACPIDRCPTPGAHAGEHVPALTTITTPSACRAMADASPLLSVAGEAMMTSSYVSRSLAIRSSMRRRLSTSSALRGGLPAVSTARPSSNRDVRIDSGCGVEVVDAVRSRRDRSVDRRGADRIQVLVPIHARRVAPSR